MQELIEYIEDFTPKNKTTSGIWSKANSLIEKEKEQIIQANEKGLSSMGFKTADFKYGTKYYDNNFGDNHEARI